MEKPDCHLDWRADGCGCLYDAGQKHHALHVRSDPAVECGEFDHLHGGPV